MFLLCEHAAFALLPNDSVGWGNDRLMFAMRAASVLSQSCCASEMLSNLAGWRDDGLSYVKCAASVFSQPIQFAESLRC